MNKIILLIFTVCLSFTAYSQDFPFGQYTPKEMAMTRYDKDTSAHAVVLREFGNAFMVNDDILTINFIYHVKIKLFDSKEFDKGTVTLNLSNGDNVKDIKGVAYYRDDKGVVQRSNLDAANIYTETNGEYEKLVKFALPNLHNGCIIEYTYTTTSEQHYNFHHWRFQADIPKVYSEYDTQIPAFYNYHIILRGPLNVSKRETSIEKSCMTIGDLEAGCIKTVYAMENIPAFVPEENMGSIHNFLSGLYFELYSFNNGNGDKKIYTDNWNKVEHSLQTSKYFGSQMQREGLLKDHLPKAIFGITDTLTKAQAIYSCIQKLFKFNDEYSLFSWDIKEAIAKHTGNNADINLSLIAALNTCGIKALPVILSTRENGVVNKIYPTETDFDYVIVKVTIGNRSYFLDASEPLLAFGLLPARCLNDEGRVLLPNKPGYWINLSLAPGKDKSITNFDLTLLDNGKVHGTVTIYSFDYAANNARLAIKGANSVEEYIENLNGSMPGLKILKSDISGIDSLNAPLSQVYEIEMDFRNKFNHDIVEFRPAFWADMAENPLKLDKRKYPLYMPQPTDNKIILTLHYPDGMMINNQPVAINLTLPQNGGSFITDFQNGQGIFIYSESLKTNKLIYNPQEYPYLKELYNKVIQNQKTNIIFKKKS